MQKLDLLLKRMIFLYLNAWDKIKLMAYLSKSWNKFVYSGYAWEVLFDQNYDSHWNLSKINEKLV